MIAANKSKQANGGAVRANEYSLRADFIQSLPTVRNAMMRRTEIEPDKMRGKSTGKLAGKRAGESAGKGGDEPGVVKN